MNSKGKIDSMHRHRFESTGGLFPGAFVSLLKPNAALVHYHSVDDSAPPNVDLIFTVRALSVEGLDLIGMRVDNVLVTQASNTFTKLATFGLFNWGAEGPAWEVSPSNLSIGLQLFKITVKRTTARIELKTQQGRRTPGFTITRSDTNAVVLTTNAGAGTIQAWVPYVIPAGLLVALPNNHLAEHITSVVDAIAAAAAAAEAWWAANVNVTYRLNGGNESLLHFRNTSAFSGGTMQAGNAIWGATGQVDGTRFTQPRWEIGWNIGKYDVSVLPGGDGWRMTTKFGNNTDRKNVIDNIFLRTGSTLDSRYKTW